MKISKEEILNNISKQGFMKPTFLKENNLSKEECYNIVYKNDNICKICNKNKAQFISFKKGYKTVCFNKNCIKINAQRNREATNLKKYGCKNVSGNKEIQKKKLDTVKKNYGKSFNELMNEKSYKNGVYKNQTKEALLKKEKTLMERYGTTDSLSINKGRERGIYKCNNNKEVITQRKRTCSDKFGGDTPFSSSEVQNKAKHTILEKYGYTNIMFSEGFLENEFAKACLERDLKRLEDIDENGLNSFERVTKQRLEDIDENGLNSFERVTKQRLEDIDENGLNSFERAGLKGNEKRRKTNEIRGNWITEELVNDFKDYYKMVWRYTNQNDLSVLKNFEKRGHANKGMYHLDHKYSIFQGYKDNISAKAIGSIYNLEMIIGRNNLTKGRKCSLTINEIKEIECRIKQI